MTGRPGDGSRSRIRHRKPRRRGKRRSPGFAVAIGAAGAILAAAGFVVATHGVTGGCQGDLALEVAAAPDITRPLQELAEHFNARDVAVDDACVDVTVKSENPARMSDVLSGVAKGDRPDVWIPDSTMWVESAQALHAGTLSSGPSIASTPLVTAVTEGTAKERGWADRKVSWGEVLSPSRPAQIADPTRETSGLGALAIARDVMGGGRITGSVVGVMRAASEASVDGIDQLFDNVRSQGGASPLVATEQAVWAYNTSQPTEPLVAIYPQEGTLVQDYPYVTVKPEKEGDERTLVAAQRFLEAVQSAEGQALIQGQGFRATTGTAGAALATADHLDVERPERFDTPDLNEVEQVLRTWEAVNLDAQMIAVMDVSGSMAAQTRGTRTRMDEARTAAEMAITLFEDSSEVGLWSFSTKLDNDRDYRELVPVAPLDGNQRGALAGALKDLTPKKGGGTGLYDTILAAFREASTDYDAEKVNSVVVLTDGENEDPDSIELQALLDTLRKEFDPEKPVPVITVAFGPDTDLGALKQISEATSGKLYVAEKPEDIADVFLDAIAQRTCRPACG